jgi:DNA (cytosine-5)-methyltransferase 1
MAAYYNEWEPYAAQWLRNLIAAGHIAPGDVDERSIVDVRADDLKGYTQCHFFAGIGGWSYALRLAGWPDDRPVWTGSCPCQDYSIAGKKRRQQGSRHLWPDWHGLIKKCRPAIIFGEQVTGAIAAGWLDDVFNDLEKDLYAGAAARLPACCVTSPQERERLFFVADRDCGECTRERTRPEEYDFALGDKRILADPDSGHEQWWSGPLQVGWNAIEGEITRSGRKRRAQWLIKPGVPLLAHGIPFRMGRIGAYGNAIVPQVAAEFIKASWDCIT